jgi:hypothetical protein
VVCLLIKLYIWHAVNNESVKTRVSVLTDMSFCTLLLRKAYLSRNLTGDQKLCHDVCNVSVWMCILRIEVGTRHEF